jgi:hypothetical protein
MGLDASSSISDSGRTGRAARLCEGPAVDVGEEDPMRLPWCFEPRATYVNAGRTTRRRTLGMVLSAAAVALPIPRLAAATSPDLVARNLEFFLADLESARAIGRAHLAAQPARADVAALVMDLAGSGVPIDVPIYRSGLARRQLRAQIRQDFADERIGVVDGWCLSLTELRLCALAALVP